MADPDPFADLFSDGNDPFADIVPKGARPVAPQTTAGGAFARGVGGGIVPLAGGLVGAGAGAEIGAGIGAAAGGFFGSVIPGAGTVAGAGAGAWLGGMLGGLGGVLAGSHAAEVAQGFAVKKMPPTWQDALGATDRQKILDETQHPVASFLGGMLPMAATMWPSRLTMKALDLPENATAIQRLMANPVTARVFPGTIMGGMEAGQEAWGGEDVDWRKVAASTVFGMVFNKPTKLGEGLMDTIAGPIRSGKAVFWNSYLRGASAGAYDWSTMYGRAGKVTIAEAADRKVLGPGITESVWEGTHIQDPAAELHAQEVARSEMEMYGPYETDVHGLVRHMEPDLFEQHDNLVRQRNVLNGWLRETEPASVDAELQMLDSRAARLQAEAAQPMWGPQRRSIEAQLQDVENQRQRLLERKAAPLIGETSGRGRQLREDIAAVDGEIEKLSPQIAAAYRRAEDYLGGRPETAREPYEGSAVPSEPAAPRATAEVARTIEQQKAAIAADVEAKLIAAGRPAAEAREAGVWWAARLATRAALWEGRLGTAEQIYKQLNLQVVGPGGRTLTPAPVAGGAAPAVPAAGGPVAPAAVPTAPVAAAAAPAVPAYAVGWTVGTKLDLGNFKNFTVRETLPDGNLILERPTGQLMRLELPATEPKKDTKGAGIEWAQYLFNVSPAELRAIEAEPVTAQPVRSAEEVAKGAMAPEEPIVSRETPPIDRGAGPEEMEGETGDRIGTFLKENDLPESARVEIAQHYQRAPGENVETALTRAIADLEARWVQEELAIEGVSALEKADAELLWQALLSDQERFGADLRIARVSEGSGRGGMPYSFTGAGVGTFGGEGTSRPGISIEAPERARDQIRRPYTSEEAPFNANELESRPGLRGGEEARGEVSAPEGTAAEAGQAERGAGEVAGEAGAAEAAPLVSLLDRMSRRARETAGTKGQEPVQAERKMLMEQVIRRLPRTSDEFLAQLRNDLQDGKYGGEAETKALWNAVGEESSKRYEARKSEEVGKILEGADSEAAASEKEASERWMDAYDDALSRGYSQQAAVRFADRRSPGQTAKAQGQIGDLTTRLEKDGAITTVGYYFREGDAYGNADLSRIIVTERADTPARKEFLTTDGKWVEGENREPPENAVRPRNRQAAEGLARSFMEGDRGETLFKSEQTAQGEQTLLPGVEPVTDRERLGVMGEKPLRGGNAPLDEELFDVSGRGQTELEQRRNMVKLGSISLEEGRTLITLARTADASSFIHESWHAWWKQMMDDAELPGAPEQIKRDVRIIFDELGVKDRAEFDALTKKYNNARDRQKNPHERVAMWGEQYAREGQAPSKELAGVFQRFYEWLQSIYQSIVDLGTPINDNIRGVFDRMQAEKPERIVVAPGERKTSGPTISEIQRADAEFTSPQDAAEVAARIDMEREIEAQKPPIEVRDEIQSEVVRVETEQAEGVDAGGKVGEGATRPAEMGGGSIERNPQPSGGVVGEGAGGERDGVGPAVAESPSIRAGQESERGTGTGTQPPLSPGPATVFSGADTGLVDKAGNIRLELLDKVANREDFRDVVRDMARANGDFTGARGGVVTDGEVEDLARAIGFEGAARKVREWVQGQTWNAAEVRAVRRLLDEVVPDVWAKSQAASLAGASEADILAYMESRARLRDIQRAVSGITAEWGRAGRAFRDLKTRIEAADPNAQQVLFQLRQEAKLTGQLVDKDAVAKFMRDAGKHSYSRMVLEYWINNLISGPATHTTYMIGNMLLSFSKFGPEALAGAIVGNVAEMMGRKGERMHAGEMLAAAQGLRHGFIPAVQASLESLRAGVTTGLPGESVASMRQFQYVAGQITPPMLNEAAKWSDVTGSLFGLQRGLRDAFVSTAKLVDVNGERVAPFMGTEYSLLGSIPNVRVGDVVLPIGTAFRLPSRAVGAIHSFFRALNFAMEKASDSYRTASNEAMEAARLGRPYDFDGRMTEFYATPTEEKMEQYRLGANDLTLMGKGSRFTQALSRLVNTEVFGRFDKNGEYVHGIPLLKFIDPFVHISSNIIDQTIIRRTPVGLLSAEIRADLSGKNGNIAQDRAMGRMLVGSAFAMAIGGLASQGLVTGSGPKDWREAALWRQAYQPHSVRIGDFWYATQRLGVMGMLLGIGADMYETAHLMSKGEMSEAAGHFQHAIMQNILDESFMRGPSDLIQAVENPERFGGQYVRNFVSSFVPYSVGMAQEARAFDPYSREARTVLDAITAKLLYYSQTLLPRIDVWGNPMPNRDALVSPGVTAVYMQRVNADPVKQAMVRLGMQTAPVERKIRGVELTPEQHYEYAVYSGRMAKSRLDVIVNSPDWQRWEPEQQRAVIQAVVRGSREAAGGLIMAKDPTIPVRSVQQKRDRAHHTNELPD